MSFELKANQAGSKADQYGLLLEQCKALIEGERHVIANLANTASLLYHSLQNINWAGFYLSEENQLILGPFHGKPACIRIPLGKGVCGTAASTKETQRVEDVHAFPGHIACDSASNSEIVIPLLHNERVYGVLDIDSPDFSRFDEEDQAFLEELVRVLVKGCNWE